MSRQGTSSRQGSTLSVASSITRMLRSNSQWHGCMRSGPLYIFVNLATRSTMPSTISSGMTNVSCPPFNGELVPSDKQLGLSIGQSVRH